MGFSNRGDLQRSIDSITEPQFKVFMGGGKKKHIKLVDNWLSESNRNELLWFVRECRASSISPVRVIKYISCFKSIQRLHSFDLWPLNADKLKDVVATIDDSLNYSIKTKSDFKTALKKYYKIKNNNEMPREVRFIKTFIKPSLDDKRRDLPDDVDIKKMIDVCSNLRDKALISSLYDLGPRIGEVGPLQIKHAIFDDRGIQLNVHGKTGTRPLRLWKSEPYMRTYLALHPAKDNPDAPLWIDYSKSKNGRIVGMNYCSIRMMLRKKAIKAGVDVKKVKPHNFRHADTRNRLKQGDPERMIVKQKGWSGKTKQIDTYANLTYEDVDEYEMRRSGRLKVADTVSILAPVECPRCGKTNMREADVCVCGMPLTKKKASEMEEARTAEMERMFEDLVNKRIDEKIAEVVKNRPTEIDMVVTDLKKQLKGQK